MAISAVLSFIPPVPVMVFAIVITMMFFRKNGYGRKK
jgi:hypothetical protein